MIPLAALATMGLPDWARRSTSRSPTALAMLTFSALPMVSAVKSLALETRTLSRPALPTLKVTAAHRARQAAAFSRRVTTMKPTLEVTQGMSFLESAAVRVPTLVDYHKRATEFVGWCRSRSLTWRLDTELDYILTLYMDEKFFKGESVEDSSKTLASLKHFVPAISRAGAAALPRALRALGAWRRLAPPRQRLPLPLLALSAMVGWVVANDRLESAWRWWIAFKCYLRPGECDALTGNQLVAPSPLAGYGYQSWGLWLHSSETSGAVPGKTGLFDETVWIDKCPELANILQHLAATRPGATPLWLTSAAEDMIIFAQAAAALGLEDIRPCRYGLRHGGASDDLMTRTRSALEVKRRGRWRSDTSLRRYAKETKILAELNKMPPRTLAYGRLVLNRIQAVLEGQHLAPPKLLPPPS